jgi:hypothetical protein
MTHFTVAESALPAYSHAFSRSLSIEELRSRTPAVFADTAAACTKPTYRFISKCGQPHLLINVVLSHMWPTATVARI